jgi:hypothetical protein
MSGTLKVGGKTLATHDTNTNVAKIQLGSTSDVVLTDSAGNNVLSEANSVVTLGDVSFSGGYLIKSSVYTLSSSVSGNQTIPWDTSTSQQTGSLNTSTGVWTCNENGVYFISTSISFYSLNNPTFPSAYSELYIKYNNGVEYTIGFSSLLDHKGGDNSVGHATSAARTISSGETIYIDHVKTGSSGANSISHTSSHLTIIKLG